MGGTRWPKGSGCRVGQRDQPLQSSNSWGSDWSNTKSGTGSASEGSKAGVWSRRKSPCGGPRAGEIGGGVSGSSRCCRMATTTGGSVMKETILMGPPQAGQWIGILE